MKLSDLLTAKNILITGVTGFVGKVFLLQVLDQFPGVNKIYILIRSGKRQSAQERFLSLQTTPSFLHLKHEKPSFGTLWNEKVHLIEGDICQKNIFLDLDQRAHLLKEIDIVVNCAAITAFQASFKKAVETNIYGVENLCDFVKQSEKARLVHTSTAYIAGEKDGYVPEILQGENSPNGKSFDYETERKWIEGKIEDLINPSQTNHEDDPKMIGIERARQWGWLNTYIYTKALGEKTIQRNLSPEQFSIVRPSIIESSVQFPMAGWNEGLNTTGTFLYLNQQGYRFFVAEPQNTIDIIPVDIVTSTLLAVCGAVLTGHHQPVYHIGTSDSSPLMIETFKEYCYHWLKESKQASGFFPRLMFSIKPRLVKPKSLFTATGLLIKFEKFCSFFEKWHLKIQTFHFLKLLKKKLAVMSMTETAFQDFSYYHTYIFENKNRMMLCYDDFHNHQKTIQDWRAYCFEKHLPGLNQWVFNHLPKILQTQDATETSP